MAAGFNSSNFRASGALALALGFYVVESNAALTAPAVPPSPSRVKLPAVPPLKSQSLAPIVRVRAAPVQAPIPASQPIAAQKASQSGGSILDAFANGKLIIDARYRYEHVEQAGFTRDANAHTIRIRAGFQTAKFWDLQLLGELEGIGHSGKRFNDTINGKVTYPTVVDPEDMQINRLQIDYTGLPSTTITVGRQRINLDNQRFVGGVAFRQNEQTFDAARITNTIIPNITATYIYLNRVNRVFGEDSPQGSFRGDSHLLNASWDIPKWGKLTGYAYYINLNSVPTQSTRTYGVRFAGRHDFAKDIGAIYTGEFARQSAGTRNPSTFGLDYWMVEGGLAVYGAKLYAGEESLAGDGARGFSTPLATLHKFQGYADIFLTTPATGINDRYGVLSYERKFNNFGPLSSVVAAVTYHDFEAEHGGKPFGSETDAELVLKLGKYWSTGVKFADYSGDGAFADRTKLWFPIEFTY